MKVIASLSYLSTLALASASNSNVFVPHRISFEDLTSGSAASSWWSDDRQQRQDLFKALSDTGLISVTNVPGLSKATMLSHLYGCLDQKETKTVKHEFPDGTTRLTLASHTVPNGIQPLAVAKDSQACHDFAGSAKDFRSRVTEVTQAFGNRLNHVLAPITSEPILTTEDGHEFSTIGDVVENGEHLEHFHSYENGSLSEEDTVEWHTDQGLFIVFTPGQFAKDLSLSHGFFIQDKGGNKIEALFEHKDDLIIMLGDGVNQYVNKHLPGDRQFRATPHAFRMPASETSSRVWYGRMVLPPALALHPDHNISFGDLRKLMIQASIDSDQNDSLYLGCSSPKAQARQLETTTCEEGAAFCWHRCMAEADFAVSEEICAADNNKQLVCQNPRDQVSDGDSHGDYYLGCLPMDAGLVTPLPSLPGFPADEEVCTNESFEDFVEKETGFDHRINLGSGGRIGPGAFFQYSVVNDKVKGRLTYNGLFGYIALGFRGPPGAAKNGMHGSTVLMALPGNDFNPVDGLDLSQPGSIREYQIPENDTMSAFRHWSSPVSELSIVIPGDDSIASARNDAGSLYSVESTECHTALMFEMSGIHKRGFNLTGSDELVWAGYQKTAFTGHHDGRGVFSLDWQAGTHEILGGQAEQEDTSTSGSAGAISIGLASVLMTFLLISGSSV